MTTYNPHDFDLPQPVGNSPRTQTYHGWLRLEDAGGWMMCSADMFDQLARLFFITSNLLVNVF